MVVTPRSRATLRPSRLESIPLPGEIALPLLSGDTSPELLGDPAAPSPSKGGQYPSPSSAPLHLTDTAPKTRVGPQLVPGRKIPSLTRKKLCGKPKPMTYLIHTCRRLRTRCENGTRQGKRNTAIDQATYIHMCVSTRDYIPNVPTPASQYWITSKCWPC